MLSFKNVNLFIKRLTDILISGLGLILFFPIFIIVAVLIKLTMPGPIFFMQERVGKDKNFSNIEI